MKKLVFILALIFNANVPAAQETPATTQPATTPTPSVADTSNMPKFPLKSNRFDSIVDDRDADDGLPDATTYDAAMMLDIIPQIKACSLEYMKANVDKTAAFKKIFNHPTDYRGHVVQFESTVKFLYEHAEHLKDANGTEYTLARGHLTSSYQMITFLSVDPLPPGLKLGDGVLLTGVFIQRFAYVNRKTPGVELTWTPLIVAKCLEPITIKEEPPLNTAWIIGYIFFALMAVGLFLMYSTKISSRNARNNIFRRMRIERGGKDRIFPGPK